MVDMIRTLNTSAHDLRGVEDGSVQLIATSPPYYGLRSYAGDQNVEWPTVTFRLNEWCEPLTVQGCEPGCSHEWVDGPVTIRHGGQTNLANVIDNRTGKPAGGAKTHAEIKSAIDNSTTQGRYCLHCGGWRGPLGLEPSPVAYIGHLILCLREWRRVLRDDGVCFVNLGDSYASGMRGGNSGHSDGVGASKRAGAAGQYNHQANRNLDPSIGLKPKDLLGIPWLFAIAARADGWWLRSDIIWAKNNPMPESVTDRPTKAHEYVFLLAKSQRYYWDADAVREAVTESSLERAQYSLNSKNSGFVKDARTGSSFEKTRNGATMGEAGFVNPAGRNIRTVWNISTAPYPGAHYAVFPERLVEPMVKAGTSERGACSACGAPWRRVVERGENPFPGSSHTHERDAEQGNTQTHESGKPAGTVMAQRWYQKQPDTTIGWQPTCACDKHAPDLDKNPFGPVENPDWLKEPFDPVPCIVLDPFSGSGTTARVATRLRRRSIICDISAEYLAEHVPARTTVQMELV